MPELIKLVVFVPIANADAVRQALGEAGAGKIGNYDFCSFSSQGVGRFRGNKHSNPTIGKPEQDQEVEEERIEVTLDKALLEKTIAAIKEAHPYEEVALDIYPLSPPQ